MIRSILGIVVASVVLYMWGYVVWGLGPYQTQIWKDPADSAALSDALRKHFPENGVYVYPSTHGGKEGATLEKEFEAGPVVMVHVMSQGRPQFDPTIFTWGFVNNVVVIVLICLLMHLTAPATPTYFSQVMLMSLIGLTSVVLIDIGNAVWWQLSWPWKLYEAAYDLSFWTFTAAILGLFIGGKKQDVRTEA